MSLPDFDDRSSHAKAMSMVSEIVAVCLLPVVATLIGIWLDSKFGTVVLFALFGFFFGAGGAVLQLLKLVSPTVNDGNGEADVAGSQGSGRGRDVE